jgi:uncharacterized protein YkwD
MALELTAFVIAGSIAIVSYHALGRALSHLISISLALGNVAAFVLIWVVIEITCAILVHRYIMRRLTHALHAAKFNRYGGAVAGSFRTLILVGLGLIIFTGLPLSAAAKQPVTGSRLATLILNSTTGLQSVISSGLGHDLNSTLTVFTVDNSPESTERVQLGFTTTSVRSDFADERAMLELVNHERTARGLTPLVMNATAQVVARAYAKRMLADGVFSHVDNDGHSPFDRMKAGDVKFRAAGENLVLAPTLPLAHQGLMNSPGHKANILSPNYRTVGIGVIDAGQYGLMVVQDFTD